MTELELKFRVDDEALARWRTLLLQQGAQQRRLSAHYFDTADGRLDRARVSLRLRHEGAGWVQTLKTAGDGTLRRQEHEVPVPGAAAGRRPSLNLDRHLGSAAFDGLLAALAGADAASLRVRHATTVERTALRVRTAGGTEAELALDEGEAVAGEHGEQGKRHSPIAELEIEYLAGPIAGLFDIAQDVLSAGGAWLGTVTKAERGARLLAAAPPPAVKAAPVTLPPGCDASAFVSAVLRNALAQVLPNLGEVAEGDEAPERIHQLRVGLRRLRTALRELAALDPRLQPEWEGPLRQAFARLGDRRDDDSAAALVRPLLEAAGAPKCRWSATAGVDLIAAARAPALQAVLLRLIACAEGAEAVSPAALPPRELKAWLARRLQGLWRRVCRDGRRFERLPADRQHQVRKRLKRLRYLAEFAAPLWSAKAAAQTTAWLSPVQDALGACNDHLVALARFRADAETDPRSLFAVGFLQARLPALAHEAQRRLRRLAERRPFWQRR
ncbi:MAG: CHAD domain-containing protein [Rubrivivax sp.]